MRLLKTVERSVLWLPTTNRTAMANLLREAEARGVGAGRLIFAPYVPRGEDHLARLRLADLFLDTLPYNAHTTASDALWAALPLLTCLGKSFPSRVAASLLRAAGLPEMVVETLDAYENLARELAGDPARLTSIRDRLEKNRGTCPLFDTARSTHDLEAAYVLMWERFQLGQPPKNFAVEGPMS
jgi:protein O-GlcNAc transferase